MKNPTPLGCFLSPRAAAETIASLQLRVSQLEGDLYFVSHANQAKAARTARFRAEANRKSPLLSLKREGAGGEGESKPPRHPAHVPEAWDDGEGSKLAQVLFDEYRNNPNEPTL